MADTNWDNMCIISQGMLSGAICLPWDFNTQVVFIDITAAISRNLLSLPKSRKVV